MPRCLSARWVRLAHGLEQEYLDTLLRVKAAVERRGGHFWLFRHPTLADVYLEFREGVGPADSAELPPFDQELDGAERRLHEIAEYTPDAEVLWEEIPLKEPWPCQDAQSK